MMKKKIYKQNLLVRLFLLVYVKLKTEKCTHSPISYMFDSINLWHYVCNDDENTHRRLVHSFIQSCSLNQLIYKIYILCTTKTQSYSSHTSRILYVDAMLESVHSLFLSFFRSFCISFISQCPIS